MLYNIHMDVPIGDTVLTIPPVAAKNSAGFLNKTVSEAHGA